MSYLDQKKYWNKNLDIQNIKECLQPDFLDSFDLETEKKFYLSPEQIYAYQKAQDLKNKKVLEIGAGIGINALIMAEKGANVFALDISKERLHLLKRLSERYNFSESIHPCIMPAELLGFKDESFDIVYTKSVLIHLDLEKVIPEIYRVLKKGGKAIFVEPLKYHPVVNLYRRFCAPKEWRTLAKYFSIKSIEEVGKKFDDFHHKEFFLKSFISFMWQFKFRNADKFIKSLNRWNKVDIFLLKLFPFLKHLCWMSVLVCEKKDSLNHEEHKAQ